MAEQAPDPLAPKRRAIQRLELAVALAHDCLVAEKLLHRRGTKDDKASARRIYIRALVASIEGTTNLRCDVLLDLDGGRRALAPAMTAVLHDEAYSVDGKGRPKAREARLSLIDRVRASLRAYMDLHPEAPRFFRSEWDSRWSDLGTVISMRNRLMHPKDANELVISEQEIALAKSVEDWYDEMTEGLFGGDTGVM